ncbi:hypothetical protein KAZ57_00915 [Patescibacteria group bacterium]|nr:hypothetical protein [Patescibacteria group bacterium]
MNIVNLLPNFCGLLALGLAFLVLFSNPRNKINQLFFLSLTSLSLWIIGEVFFRNATSIPAAFFWARAENFFGIMTAILFVVFTHYFPYQSSSFSPVKKIILGLFVGVSSLVIFTPDFYIVDVFIDPPFNNFFLSAFGRTVYLLIFCSSVVFAYYNLFHKYLSIGGSMRNNILVIVLATSLLASLGTFLGVVIPAVYGHDNQWYVSLFSFPLVVIIGWFVLLRRT